MIFRKATLLLLFFLMFVAVSQTQAQPTITTMTLQNLNPTNDPFLTWRITFSEPVTGVSTSNFSLTPTGTVAATLDSVTSAPGNATWFVHASGVSGNGTLGASLDNPSGINGSSGALGQTIVGPAYTVDNTDPQVVSITRLDPSPTGASTVNFEITFSEPVVNVSTINFAPAGTLTGTVGNVTNINGVTWTASISGISGSGTIRLDLYDTSNITDLAGNWLFSDFAAGESYVIDQTPAALLCISTIDTNPTSATSVQYRVEFDDPVSSVTAANFSVLTTGNATGTISDVSPETVGNTLETVWIVTVDTISGDGTLALELSDPTNIVDEFGNETTSTGTGCPNQNIYTIDNTAPSVDCISRIEPSPTSADTVSFAIGFDEPVTGVSAANFAVTGSGTVTYTTVTVNPTSNSVATTWTVTISGISGDGDLTLTYQSPTLVTDETGNPGVSTIPTSCNDNIYVIDNQLPVIGACLELVEPYENPDLTSNTTVQFRLVFNEPVQGLSTSNFALGTLTNITSSPVISDVSPVSPADPAVDLDEEWVVTVTNINVVTTTTVENGLLELIFDNATNITDEAGNTITGFSPCSASYTVDQRAPEITCIERYPVTTATATITSSAVVQYLVTFREPVTNIDPSDFETVASPTTGSITGTVTAVDPATSPSDSLTYIVTVGNIVGSVTNPYERLTTQVSPVGASLGNGELRLTLAPATDITDIAGNPVDPVNVDTLCNEWYLIDQVQPEVVSILMANESCLTTASFTVTFSEEVRPLQLDDLNLVWTSGDCGTTPVIGSISPGDWSDEFTVTVVSPTSEPLHLSGPGYLSLEITAPSTVHDPAYNELLNVPFSSESYFICRCFEDAVVSYPDSVTTSGLIYPQPSPQFDGPETTSCEEFGLLTLPFGDTPTTVTNPDSIRWYATEWDCATTTPFSVYLDGVLLDVTDGNTTNPVQPPAGTTNSLCSLDGEQFSLPFPAPITPGLHTINVQINGACTSGTTFYFNALDRPTLLSPTEDFTACRFPRAFSWEGVSGATGYAVYLRDTSTSISELQAETTAPVTFVELPTLMLPPGQYEWYVIAYNEYGHIRSEPRPFEITVDDVDLPNLFTTNGTIYDIHVTSSTTYIAGDFTLVRDANGWQPQAAIAALDNATSTIVTSFAPTVNNTVFDIEPYQNSLLIGGRFTNVNGVQLARMARLNTADGALIADSALGQADGPIYTIAVDGNRVYFGGDFDRINATIYNFGTPGTPASNLAVLDVTTTATSSSAVASLNPNAPVRDLLVDPADNILYIAGEFTQIGGLPIHALARAPLPLGAAIDPAFNIDVEASISHYVYDLHKVGNQLYFGGSFTSVQGEDRQNAASILIGNASTTATVSQWNPSPSSAVYSLDSAGPGAPIYLGGTFTTVRGGDTLRERATYLVGVDPIFGLPITCSYNADRVIYSVEVDTSVPGGMSPIFAGGQATVTGTSGSAP